MINESSADIYLSIHLNADVSSMWSGAQVFYDDINTKNKKIKSKAVNISLSSKNRPVKFKN